MARSAVFFPGVAFTLTLDCFHSIYLIRSQIRLFPPARLSPNTRHSACMPGAHRGQPCPYFTVRILHSAR